MIYTKQQIIFRPIDYRTSEKICQTTWYFFGIRIYRRDKVIATLSS